MYLLILSLDPGRYSHRAQHMPKKMRLMPHHTTVRRLCRRGTRCWSVTLRLSQPTSSRQKLFFTSAPLASETLSIAKSPSPRGPSSMTSADVVPLSNVSITVCSDPSGVSPLGKDWPIAINFPSRFRPR